MPCPAANFLARIISPRPELSIKRTAERSTLAEPWAAACARWALVFHQTSSTLAAVISPCQRNGVSESPGGSDTVSDCSHCSRAKSSRAPARSGAVRNKVSSRMSRRPRCTEWLGLNRTSRPDGAQVFLKADKQGHAGAVDAGDVGEIKQAMTAVDDCFGKERGTISNCGEVEVVGELDALPARLVEERDAGFGAMRFSRSK